MAAANSAAQVSTVLKTGRTPSAWRTPRTTSSRMPRIWPIWASEKPCRFASRSVASSIRSAAATWSATSLIRKSWSTNQGSIFVASKTCSAVAPARIASMTSLSRPSCGVLVLSSSAAISSWCSRSRPLGSGVKSKTAALLSSERSAFWSASVKLRPIAIASPTDFMCVVSVGSAPGNFSNAKRGTFTTT